MRRLWPCGRKSSKDLLCNSNLKSILMLAYRSSWLVLGLILFWVDLISKSKPCSDQGSLFSLIIELLTLLVLEVWRRLPSTKMMMIKIQDIKQVKRLELTKKRVPSSTHRSMKERQIEVVARARASVAVMHLKWPTFRKDIKVILQKVAENRWLWCLNICLETLGKYRNRKVQL